MKRPNSIIDAASDRLFREYERYLDQRDEDVLFNFLNALHSFNDKLKSYKPTQFHDSKNFVALKALRNLFHHDTELLNKFVLTTEIVDPIVGELQHLCLVDRTLVLKAAEHAAKRFKANIQDIKEAFRFYADVCDIEPAIFNVMVDAFELISNIKCSPISESFKRFADIYQFEEQNGYPHRISGKIICHAGSVEKFLAKLYKEGRDTKALSE